MIFSGPYQGDSDADDEYERSVMISPHLADDSETSPTDSEAPSTENTPTTHGNTGDERKSPKPIITEWTVDECVKFSASLGLLQYCETFRENEIVGEALIALKHDELKEMGINSVGHRLTILKSVYETKLKQGVPFDPDHYVPLSAETNTTKDPATQDDVALLVLSIRKRDERLMATEAELRKLADDYRKLREELLPVFKMAKDKSQPLPYQPPTSSWGGSTLMSDQYNGNSNNSNNNNNNNNNSHEQSATSPSVAATQEKPGTSLTRTFSKRLFAGGATPKNNSPTHIPQSIPEGRAYNDTSTLDPSAAAMAASSHLTASMTGGQPSPKGMPSPTSPGSFYNQQTLGARSYSRETASTNGNRTMYEHEDSDMPHQRDRGDTITGLGQGPGRQDHTAPGNPGSSTRNANANSNEPSGPSVEIFKSFRVSMDDPCHKVLPAALKKYNIPEDWRLYALYIVYGDQERCLGLEEKPLILFKQLQKDGRNPMFMLRKQAQLVDGQITSLYPGFPPPGMGVTPGNPGLPGTSYDGGNGNMGGGPSMKFGGASIPGGGGMHSNSSLRAPSTIQLPGGVL